jgi:hypothetical protein
MRFTRFCSIVTVFAMTACGGGEGGEDTNASESPSADAPPAVDPAQAATISGTVNYGGQPEAQPIDMSAEPDCAEKHTGTPTRKIVDVNGGKLRNVFVYVKEGLPQRGWQTVGEVPVLDQEGCEYKPHVLAVRAGQDFIIRNSDGLLHNVNAKPKSNRGFNVGQPTKMDTKKQFSQPEVMVPVTCEVHGWMQSYIGVLDHPFYAVTNEDGSFSIQGLPPGTYTVEAWHEKLGTKTMQVTVAAQETKVADFTFGPATAKTKVPLGKPFDPHTHLAHNTQH